MVSEFAGRKTEYIAARFVMLVDASVLSIGSSAFPCKLREQSFLYATFKKLHDGGTKDVISIKIWQEVVYPLRKSGYPLNYNDQWKTAGLYNLDRLVLGGSSSFF